VALEPGENSFAWLVKEYLESAQHSRRAAVTQKDYIQASKKPLAVFAKLEADSITAPMLRRYMDQRGKASPYRANRELAFMSTVFAYGKERGFVSSNPATDVRHFPEQRRDRYVSDEDYQAVHKVAPPPVRVAMELAITMGLRRADVLNLTWDKVTEDGILVKQQKNRTPLLKAWSDRLRAAVDAAKSLPCTRGVHSLYVVHTRTGARYTDSGFAKVLARAVKAGGQDWTFHDLRRTAITDADGDKRFSGHKTDAMAQRYNVKPIRSPSH
jgi:integrase